MSDALNETEVGKALAAFKAEWDKEHPNVASLAYEVQSAFLKGWEAGQARAHEFFRGIIEGKDSK